MAKPGTILAGKYRVQRLLGTGGMGAVVAARELTSNMLVAVKFLLPARTATANLYDRFIREARILSVLRNESLATVFDSGVLENGMPYFAMEYIDGVDLSVLIVDHAPLAINHATDVIIQVCRCIAEVHRHGLVHRDLKPENIRLTTRPDGSVLIKVIDFGLSKILSGELAKHLSSHQPPSVGILGTPAYMPPEQARSAALVDRRSDIWSIGAILYHMLSGKLPFPATNPAEALAKLVVMSPTPLHDVAPWVPEAMQAVVMRCLEREPSSRYQTAHELTLALNPFTSTRRQDSAAPLVEALAKRPPRANLAELVGQSLITLVDEGDRTYEENERSAEELSITDMIDVRDIRAAIANERSRNPESNATRIDSAVLPQSPEGLGELATTMQPQAGDPWLDTVEQAIGTIPERIQALREASLRQDASAIVHACEQLCEEARAVGAEHLAHLGEVVKELAKRGMTKLGADFIGEIEQEFQSVFRTLLAITQQTSTM